MGVGKEVGREGQQVPKRRVGICEINLFLPVVKCHPITKISRHFMFPENRGLSMEMLIQGALGERLSSVAQGSGGGNVSFVPFCPQKPRLQPPGPVQGKQRQSDLS